MKEGVQLVGVISLQVTQWSNQQDCPPAPLAWHVLGTMPGQVQPPPWCWCTQSLPLLGATPALPAVQPLPGHGPGLEVGTEGMELEMPGGRIWAYVVRLFMCHFMP